MMSKRTALITGIAGQDGSFLAELLLEQGYEVTGLSRHGEGGPLGASEHLRERIGLIGVDITDTGALTAAIGSLRPAEIYHLAAPSFVPGSWAQPGQTLRAIAAAGAEILSTVRDTDPGVRVFVASSGAIFGDTTESPQRETTPPHPSTPYAIAKLALHQLVGAMRTHDGLHASSGIFFNHESERRSEAFVTRRISRAAAAIALGMETELTLGSLDAVRDWSFAGDIVRAAWLMLQQDEPGDYVLASGVGRTVAELARTAFACVGLDADDHIRVDQSLVRATEPVPSVGDPSRARERLGWQPSISFEQLIERMVRADLRSLEGARGAGAWDLRHIAYTPGPMRKIGVIGLGYVGLPLAVAFGRAGCEVIGVDVDSRKIRDIEAGRSYIEDVPDSDLQEIADRLTVADNFDPLAEADAVLICVPTPLSRNREPDLTPLIESARSLSRVLQAGQLIVLESTTYPGTTRERLRPLLEESGLTAGRDFHLAFSPERVDPGRTDFTLRNTPKVVGGLTAECAERASELYGLVCDRIVPVTSPEAAELTKLLENVFRSVNIALVNELAMLTDRMGINIWEVVDAAATKPYGFMRFDPGPGMGGHCLPVDPFYLSWRAREFDMATEFIELAGKVNQQMPYHCVAKAQRVLNEGGLSVNGARIAVVGVSYKPGVGDIRESPALKIISVLRELGAEVSYHDPHVPELAAEGLKSIPLDELVSETDLLLIVTAHPSVDHEELVSRVGRVVDLRGVTRLDKPSNVTLL